MAGRKKSSDKEKSTTVERMLAKDEYILVHLCPTFKEVDLPQHLLSLNTVTLKLSRLFRGKTVVSKSSVEADLLFGDRYFTCKMPLGAIWGVTGQSGEFMVWPESAPQELFEQISVEKEKIEKVKKEKPALKLQRIKDSETSIKEEDAGSHVEILSEKSSGGEKGAIDEKTPKKRPHLRRIK